MRLAKVLIELGELAEAQAELSRALEADPADAAALDLMARVRHIRGELTEALACWRLLASIRLAERGGRGWPRRHQRAHEVASLRASFADAVEAATERYLPLPWLARLSLPGPRLRAGWSPRARGVALALSDDLRAARAEIGDGSLGGLDLHYLGDLALLAGQDDEGTALHLAAMEGDNGEARAWSLLADRHLSRANPLLAERLRDPRLERSARAALTRAAEAAPCDPARLRRLAALEELVGRGEEAAQLIERASCFERKRGVGRALSAAVYSLPDGPRGLIHEVWATRTRRAPGGWGGLSPDQVLGNVTPELRAGTLNAFVAVREFALARFPHLTADAHEWDVAFKVTKDDETSSGGSAGLPTALAFLSLLLQRPLRRDVASTGALVADAHDVLAVRPVGDVEHKVIAAHQRDLRRIIVPAANRRDLERCGAVPASIRDSLVRYVSGLEEAVPLAFEDPPR